MAEIRAAFFIECEDLLEELQDGLQAMDDGLADTETINTVFRAVHSIKGGAGAFGLDALVGFAHRFETALDEVRAGRMEATGEVVSVFVSGSDILADLVQGSREGVAVPDSRIAPVTAALDTLIAPPADGSDATDDTTQIDFQPMALSLDLDLDTTAPAATPPHGWDIGFRPETSLFEAGNEPLYLFRALSELGPLTVSCDDAGVPPLDALVPEEACLGWRASLTTPESAAAIEDIFEFVDGLCQLDIRPSERHSPGATDHPDTPAPPQPTPAVSPPQLPASAPPGSARSASPDLAGERPAEPAPVTPVSTVRVDLERIDRLVNLVGELVINQAMLSQSIDAAGVAPNSPVRAGLEEFLQLTRDIQDSVMMIRAQPVKSLFQRMGRILREAAADIGKEVRLHTEGENTEVDKTVIERLADPLTHMIRNAIDHGLEDPQTRAALGKPHVGHVFLRASHRSGRIVIEIGDDGAGIDRERIRDKAIDRGLIAADSTLADSEIDNLLFLPGFSTADQISRLSGRGVGMDVVRSAIQALGGRISISSRPGAGTTFSISLPLTLAVLDGMVVKVASETIVVPLGAIHETLALAEDDLRRLGPTTHVVNVRDQFVPLLDLGAELGFRAPLGAYAGQVLLLIGQEDGSSAAVVVDAIEDQRQVVIKGLADNYGRVPGIAAATILGDGQIALILDPADLISQARGHTRAPAAAPAASSLHPAAGLQP